MQWVYNGGILLPKIVHGTVSPRARLVFHAAGFMSQNLVLKITVEGCHAYSKGRLLAELLDHSSGCSRKGIWNNFTVKRGRLASVGITVPSFPLSHQPFS